MKSDTTETLSAPLAELVEFLAHTPDRRDEELSDSAETPFFLSKVSDRASAFYEKIRSAVDNKEEHFLRRHAIRRVVKRIGWYSADPTLITTTLLRELYRGGYLPKEHVSRHTEEEVQKTIEAFMRLNNAVRASVEVSEFIQLKSRLLDIVSGAIEDRLYVATHDDPTVLTLVRIISDALSVEGYRGLTEETVNKLVYFAAWRSLFGADSSLLVYKLWRMEHPGWETAEELDLLALGAVFPKFVTRSNRLLTHPLGERILPRIRNLAIAMTVVYEMVKRYEGSLGVILRNPDECDMRVREIITERYKKDLSRSRQRALRALVYIFLTKALLATLVEAAYLSLWSGSLNGVALAVNVLFHPILLFVLTLGLVVPGRHNTERLVQLIHQIVYRKLPYAIRIEAPRFGIVRDIALAVYIAILSALFVGMTWALKKIGFHAVDIGIFFVFLALVVYFGFRIRYAARGMELRGGREGFLRSFIELLALPVVSVGRWLVMKFERLNIVAIFLDFFIELPLKLVLQFFDSFSRVLRETKEEIYS
jgi:hypothetical protein